MNYEITVRIIVEAEVDDINKFDYQVYRIMHRMGEVARKRLKKVGVKDVALKDSDVRPTDEKITPRTKSDVDYIIPKNDTKDDTVPKDEQKPDTPNKTGKGPAKEDPMSRGSKKSNPIGDILNRFRRNR